MNIDHTRMTAELRVNVCGRLLSRSLTRFTMTVGRAGMVCVLACVAAGAAQAQDRGGFRKDDLQQQSPPRPDERSDHGDRNTQRQDAARYEQRADDARRQQQDRNAEAQRRSGRLTPDERRDLRRQINEAGVELYPNTPRR